MELGFLPGKLAVDLVSRKALAAGESVKYTAKTPAASAMRLTVVTKSTAYEPAMGGSRQGLRKLASSRREAKRSARNVTRRAGRGFRNGWPHPAVGGSLCEYWQVVDFITT